MESKTPFRFYTRTHLREPTGLKAKNLRELLDRLRTVPESVVYQHTHQFLQQHQYLSPEPPNDFAYWVREALNEVELGEILSSINTCEFSNLEDLRRAICDAVEKWLQSHKDGPLQEARPGQEFYFLKSVSFILPTPYEVRSLAEFHDVLRRISIHSLYFHMFEARLRLKRGTNDFSVWFENALGEAELAKKISKLDPYTHTMEGLREKILLLVEERMAKHA